MSFSASPDRKFKSYEESAKELRPLLVGHWMIDLSNFASFVFHELPDLNWAGFYLNTKEKLILGPFCGKPACTEIRFNRGVCGTAFSAQKSLIVGNVHEFPGHIACDAASNAEIVMPLVVNGVAIGVLDLDSPTLDRFDEPDRKGLELWTRILLEKIPAPQLLGMPWNA